jgi:hypothetical protein
MDWNLGLKLVEEIQKKLWNSALAILCRSPEKTKRHV